MRERRKFVRIPENLPISYKLMPSIKTEEIITQDISQGGLRFFVYEFVPKNNFLKIRITLKKIYFSFEALVRVVWIKEQPLAERYEVGVEFINMPKETAERLIDYIKKYLRI